jgi:hypothetical protein
MRGSACAAKRSRPESVRIRGWQRSPEQSALSQQLRPTEGRAPARLQRFPKAVEVYWLSHHRPHARQQQR